MNLTGKKISVIGAIRSGLGAARLIKRLGGTPFVSDMGISAKLIESVKELEKDGIAYETGAHSEKVFDCEMMIVSPGVPLDSPVIIQAKEKGIKMISEVELAWSHCRGKVIATTGTNGKTTTTSLIAHVFNTCGQKTYAAGNIGKAFSEIALDVKEDEFVSLEVSSFQIDLTDQFKPDAALILNITPDHLNRYENSFQKYINSKMNIFRNMDKSDAVILNKDDEVIEKNLQGLNSRVYYFSLKDKVNEGCFYDGKNISYIENGKVGFSFSASELFIKGEHNIANSMAAVIAAKIYEFANNDILKGLKSFKGVEHRLEFVREIAGVKYINDSKATNVESVWHALRSFDQPMFLILGGQDTGNDYSRIKYLIEEKVKKIYAVGTSSDKIFNYFHSLIKVEVKKTMEDAVTTANQEARSGDIVLLSPACKSFDMYTSYEHRGEVFKKAVLSL